MESNTSTTGVHILLFLSLVLALPLLFCPEVEDANNFGKYDSTMANIVATNAVLSTSERIMVRKDDHHADKVLADEDGGYGAVR